MTRPTFKSAPRLSALTLMCLAALALVARTHTSASSGSHAPVAAASSRAGAVTVRAAGRGKPFLNLRDGREMATEYRGDASASQALASGTARPLALATADFDSDGAPDLVSGYASDSGGIITFRRGNIEAFAPTRPEVFRAIQEGQPPDSLLPGASASVVPERPDFLLAGDFNHDGFKDVLAAARGGSLYLLAGDGAGGFNAPARIDLPGGVTALAAGEFGRPDGQTDVAVGVAGEAPQVLVSTGALAGKWQSFSLTAEASALALGRLDKDLNYDLAVAAGEGVEIIHGSALPRSKTAGALKGAPSSSPVKESAAVKGESAAKASATAKEAAVSGAINKEAVIRDQSAGVERVALPSPARSLVLGSFVWNRDMRETLAVLSADGAVRLLAPADLDTRRFTEEEEQVRALRRAGEIDLDDYRPAPWRAEANNAWRIAGQLGAVAPPAEGEAVQTPLAASHMTYGDTADLIAVNAGARQVQVVRRVAEQLRAESAASAPASLAALAQSATLDVVGSPVALVEMPRQVNGTRDLVMLTRESASPVVVPNAALAAITVDRTDDNAGASACTAAGNDCSLRGAVTFANANAGTTINLPANTYQITIANASSANENANATGDLDVTGGASGVSFVGAGAATTIIQETVADRIFEATPLESAGFTASWSGIKFTGGDVNYASGAKAGGAVLTGGNNYNITFSSCTFDANTTATATVSNGGAFSSATFAASTNSGDVHVTNCTFTNNSAFAGTGGAIRISAGTGTANALNVSGGTFDNNQATNNEGGALALTSNAAPTTTSYTVSKVTFTNNKALTTAAGTGGGAIQKSNGTLTVSFSRFHGNVASGGLGEGVKLGGSDNITATNNWWGCNDDPTDNNPTGPPPHPPASCDTAGVASATGVGTLTVNPRLQLKHTASPSTIVTGQTTTLTASFNTNSANTDVSANIDVLLGLPITFNNPVRGVLSGAGSVIQTAGVGKGTATATFRASAAGAGSADAIVDGVVPSATDPSRAAITINKADTTSTITSDTPDPTVSGQSFTVNFSLAVNSPGSNNPTVPTGSVTVTADTGESCTGSINALTPATGSCSITIFNAGSRTLTAVYGGDANFNISPASSPATAHTVNKADTTTTITSDNPDPSVTNQSVTVAYSVSVNSPGSAQAGNPTGNVVVTDNGNTFCTGTVAGTGSCSAQLTSAGPHSFVATYGGDTNYNASPASSPATDHTVNKADTTAAILTVSANPTTRGQQFAVGYAVSVTSPGSNSPTAPTGNVQITDGVDSCTGTVAAGTCNITLFTVGNRTLTATYQGDSNFNASPASTGVPHTVNKINTTTAVQSSKNPSDVGDNVTFTATITPASGTDVPSGTVQFRDGPSGTGTPIGGPATVTNGVATVQTSALTAGTHTITADYSGDTNLNSSTGTLAGGQLVINPTPTSPGDILITEFRFHGTGVPSGAQDEFIELYNNTNHSITVPASGYPLMTIDTGNTISLVYTVPPNTTIPAGAHFLITNQTPAVGFSLGGYPAGTGTVGTGDGSYTNKDLDNGGGIALFNNTSPLDLTTRLDAVGFISAPDALYREGAGISPSGGIVSDGQYSFVRKLTSGLPQNTNDNAADFVFVANDGGLYNGVLALLGAPAPESMASPIQRNATIKATLIDPGCAGTATNPASPTACEKERNTTPVTNGALGTLSIRRKFTNLTGAGVTRLRFRVVDVTGPTNQPPGTADLRVFTSPTIASASLSGGGSTAIQGLTLETPPSQGLGGGLNSTVSAGVITLGAPLANGASINVHFLLGVQTSGHFRFFVNVEALP